MSVFVHFPVFAFTAILPLLGAAPGAALTPAQMLGLLGVALAFHLFAYLLNDVVDLPLDRTESLRATSPLVLGTLGRWQTLALTILQVPLALALTAWLGGSPTAYAALGCGLALIAIYDLWGKRTPFPPLTDLLQGIGWAMLVLYGADIAGSQSTRLTIVLFGFVVLYIIIVSGIYGSLRDLANDMSCGAHTTAILFGARMHTGDQVAIPRRLKVYTLAMQILISGTLALPLAENWFGYDPPAWGFAAAALLLTLALSWVLLLISARASNNRSRMTFFGLWQGVVMLIALVLLFAAFLDQRLLMVVLAVFVMPFLMSDLLYRTVSRWLQRRGAWAGGQTHQG
jgi:4-hydroxybenzoate polyprenyltransferase